MADPNKKYGLFIPKNKKTTVKSTNVFDDDSDDDLPGMAVVNATINREADKLKVKRQTQLAIDKALEEDPNVYEYDNIYEDMQTTKAQTDEAAKAKKDSKPKYIAGLLKAAEKRKLEHERLQEKKIQKEREDEGGEFEDKEVFVTGKYKEKLQQMEEEAERERREAAMEELLDVKKQKDMSGFYRYLLNEKTGNSGQNGERTEETGSSEVTAEPDTSHVKVEPESRVKTEPASEADSCHVKSEQQDQDSEGQKRKHAVSSSSADDSSDMDTHNSKDAKRSKDRGQASRSPGRKKRSRSSDRQETLSPGKRKRSRDRNRRSRSKERSLGGRDPRRTGGNSDDRHKRSDRSRSRERHSDRHSHSNKHKRHRSSSKDRRSRSSKHSRSRSRDRKSKSKRSRSTEKHTKSPDTKVVSMLENDLGVQTKESGSEENVKDTDVKVKYVKHTTDKSLNDAKARYLARQLAKEKARQITDNT